VEVIKMRDKDIWKILAISVAFVIVASSVAIFSTANFGIGEERIEESGGKGIISLVPPPFIEVAGASKSYVAATNLDTNESFSSIQAAIDDQDTKCGHTITINPGYYIENVNVYKSLTIKSVEWNPNNTVIKAADSSDPVINITANNVSIIGLRTEGSTTPFATGILLFNVSHCNIANCFATMNCNGIAMMSSSDNRLYNNSASLNRYHGIALISSNNNIIEHNNISESEINGISLEKSANNLILNNIQESNHVFGIQLLSSDYNTLTQNRASNNTNNGIYLRDSNNNKVINNTAVENRRHGISLGTSNNTEIQDNTAARNTYQGIGLWDSEGNVIVNNLVLNNGDNGIYLNNANGNRIAGNNASYNNRSGINLYSSANLLSSKENVIENNLALNNSGDGITLWNSERNVVLNNLALNNGDNGIYLNNANDNRIIGNNASYNKGSGIFVHSSTSEIRQNVANSNFCEGIETYNSDESIVEENICENNNRAKPDLVIKHVFGIGHYPGNIPVDIRIENRGLTNAEPPFTVEVVAKYKRQLDVWYETKRVDVRNVLSPGKYVDVCITLKKHGADWDGTFPITVHVDRWNSVVESNEDNNIYHGMGRIIRV